MITNLEIGEPRVVHHMAGQKRVKGSSRRADLRPY